MKILRRLPLLMMVLLCSCSNQGKIYYDVHYEYQVDKLRYLVRFDRDRDGQVEKDEYTYVGVNYFHKVDRNGYWEHNNALYLYKNNTLIVYE